MQLVQPYSHDIISTDVTVVVVVGRARFIL